MKEKDKYMYVNNSWKKQLNPSRKKIEVEEKEAKNGWI